MKTKILGQKKQKKTSILNQNIINQRSREIVVVVVAAAVSEVRTE